jgi:hypothetical protein
MGDKAYNSAQRHEVIGSGHKRRERRRRENVKQEETLAVHIFASRSF